MAKTKNSAEDFVRAYMENLESGTAAIAEALGISVGTVSTKAAAYRKKGVNLPKLKRGTGTRLDIARLNTIVGKAGQ